MHERIGAYRIEAELGRGGMGVVYAARHPELKRRVALKLLLETDSKARARFAREATALGRLNHPNIVTVHEHAEDPAGPYLVMDLIEGESLEERLRRDGPLPAEEAARLAVGMCDALGAAHAAGILHRDLKPGNVLLSSEHDRPLLTDFGLARRIDPDTPEKLTKTGELLGTPAFMAPEQTGAGGTVDERSDVYGVGATLYGALTGLAPFRAPSLLNLVHAVLVQPPRPPGEIQPDVPADLEAVVLKCLAKRPDDRYPDAAALRADLERFRQGEAVTARVGGRNPLVVPLAVVTVLLIATAGALAIRLGSTPSQAPSDDATTAHSPTPSPTVASSPADPALARRREEQLMERAELVITEAKRYMTDPPRMVELLAEAWTRSFADAPATSPARRKLAKYYAQSLFMTSLGRARDQDKLRALMERILALYPDHPGALLRFARRPARNKEAVVRAHRSIDRLIELEGRKPTYLSIKAENFVRQDLNDEALAWAREATAGGGDYFTFRVLGDVHLRRGELLPAIEALTRAMTFRRHHDAYTRRGAAYMKLGRLDEAEQDYLVAQKLHDKFSVPPAQLGRIELRRKRPKRALPHFDRAIELRAGDPSLHYWRAVARYQTGNLSGARSDLLVQRRQPNAIKYQPADAEALLRKIEAELKRR